MQACAKFSGVARRKSREKKENGTQKGRLRVHDPFELIRWLALSQPDPRKALAELVQNSLDAGARHVHITRVRAKKVVCLKIRDDGRCHPRAISPKGAPIHRDSYRPQS